MIINLDIGEIMFRSYVFRRHASEKRVSNQRCRNPNTTDSNCILFRVTKKVLGKVGISFLNIFDFFLEEYSREHNAEFSVDLYN